MEEVLRCGRVHERYRFRQSDASETRKHAFRQPPLTSETVVASTWISAKSPQSYSATDGGEQEAGTARGILRASRYWQLECEVSLLF